MRSKEEIRSQIVKQGLLPLFYHDSYDVSLAVTKTMIHAGLQVLEYTNRGERSLDNFIALKQVINREFPHFILGIGTIKTIDEAHKFMEAGADFVVSPIVDWQIGKFVTNHNLLWIPGAMTPSEIASAQKISTFSIIKIFPANVVGPQFIKSVTDIFPGQLFIPTGGVELTLDSITDWFGAGVCAIGLGSKLVTREVLQNGDYQALHENITRVLTFIKEARS